LFRYYVYVQFCLQRNDLYCVGWDVKPYSVTHSLTVMSTGDEVWLMFSELLGTATIRRWTQQNLLVGINFSKTDEKANLYECSSYSIL